MRTSNRNSGVATVAAVTIAKLVAPLKVLNMDDNELSLMKEIVLFNPGQQSATHTIIALTILDSCLFGVLKRLQTKCDVVLMLCTSLDRDSLQIVECKTSNPSFAQSICGLSTCSPM